MAPIRMTSATVHGMHSSTTDRTTNERENDMARRNRVFTVEIETDEGLDDSTLLSLIRYRFTDAQVQVTEHFTNSEGVRTSGYAG